MKEKIISECENNHYFLGGVCPYCGKPVKKTYEYRPGDCIYCGQLCIEGAYGCNSPVPIE